MFEIFVKDFKEIKDWICKYWKEKKKEISELNLSKQIYIAFVYSLIVCAIYTIKIASLESKIFKENTDCWLFWFVSTYLLTHLYDVLLTLKFKNKIKKFTSIVRKSGYFLIFIVLITLSELHHNLNKIDSIWGIAVFMLTIAFIIITFKVRNIIFWSLFVNLLIFIVLSFCTNYFVNSWMNSKDRVTSYNDLKGQTYNDDLKKLYESYYILEGGVPNKIIESTDVINGTNVKKKRTILLKMKEEKN